MVDLEEPRDGVRSCSCGCLAVLVSASVMLLATVGLIDVVRAVWP